MCAFHFTIRETETEELASGRARNDTKAHALNKDSILLIKHENNGDKQPMMRI